MKKFTKFLSSKMNKDMLTNCNLAFESTMIIGNVDSKKPKLIKCKLREPFKIIRKDNTLFIIQKPHSGM